MSHITIYLPGRPDPIGCEGDYMLLDSNDTIVIKRHSESSSTIYDMQHDTIAIISRAGAVFMQKNEYVPDLTKMEE